MSERSIPTANRGNEIAVLRKQLRSDFLVAGSILSALVLLCVLADPFRQVGDWSQHPGWGWVDEAVVFAALSHVVMLCFGRRRSLDLKREFADRRAAQRLLLHQLHHDDLTGLPNRTAMKRLPLPGAAGLPDEPGSLPTGPLSAALLIDLDRFQEINGSLGHELGDRLLQAVARRLQGLLADGQHLYRWGGDEFAILMGPPRPPAETGGTARERAIELAAQVRNALQEPLSVQSLVLRTDATIGLALAPEHGTTVGTLTRRADLALNAAKTGQSGVEVFDQVLEKRMDARVALSADLRHALDHDEFTLHYQPLVARPGVQVCRVEALARWEHPDEGLLTPDSFLDVAESTGLVHGLTRWVLARALDDVVRWRGQGLDMTVAVNLSARNLLEADLPERIGVMLAERALLPAALELEITESTMMLDPVRSLAVLRRLRSLGIALSVDDFGTGHSSLAYLCHLPVSTVKIDRSFIQGLCSSEAHRTIVRSTVDLARNLRLLVVAEGVDSPETWALLSEYGCTYAQGHWLSPPVPAEQVPEHLEQARRRILDSAVLTTG
ncbi:MAG: Diguanylate cyclase (GGDEF)-like protein [Actinomycetota bacterium]|nr:Diguanylate cyclase (GGDEF)-like protein [Actinomycetota bacterium]